MTLLARRWEPVARGDRHLAGMVDRAAARADLEVLARPMVILARFEKRFICHVAHLLPPALHVPDFERPTGQENAIVEGL